MTKKTQAQQQETIKDTQFEKLIQQASESKHTDAVLHLYASKEIVKDNYMTILNELEKESPIPEGVKKLLSVWSEFIFKQCVQALLDDKNEDVKE